MYNYYSCVSVRAFSFDRTWCFLSLCLIKVQKVDIPLPKFPKGLGTVGILRALDMVTGYSAQQKIVVAAVCCGALVTMTCNPWGLAQTLLRIHAKAFPQLT